MRQQRLEIVIEIVNQARKDIEKIKDELFSLSNEVKSVSSKIAKESPFQKWTADIAHLYGTFLAFSAAFQSNPLSELVETGIQYNRQLELSQIGVAGILSSIAEITDEQGNLLDGQKKFARALEISSAAAKKLEMIGMSTTAEYTELVQAFQAILAPALSANLSLEQTIELTGLLTNTVKAMGLEMNQVAQEARDLVSGTIDQNTQLAKSLQIETEMVKKWKEQGTLFENLKKKMEGFILAQKAFADTLEGQISNLRDVTSKILGEGSKPLFEYLKKELSEITEHLVVVKRNKVGEVIDVQLNKEVVDTLKEISFQLIQLSELIKNIVLDISRFAYENKELLKTLLQLAVFYKVGKWVSSLSIELIKLSKSFISVAIEVATATRKFQKLMEVLKNLIKFSAAFRGGLAGLGLLTVYELYKFFDKAGQYEYIDKLANKIEREYGKKIGRFVIEKTIEKYGKFFTEEQLVRALGEGLVKPVYEKDAIKKLFSSPIKDVIISKQDLDKILNTQNKKQKIDLTKVRAKEQDTKASQVEQILSQLKEQKEKIQQSIYTIDANQMEKELIDLFYQYQKLIEEFGNRPEFAPIFEEMGEKIVEKYKKQRELQIQKLKDSLSSLDISAFDKEEIEDAVSEAFDKASKKEVDLYEIKRRELSYYQEILTLESLSTYRRQRLLAKYFETLKQLREKDVREEARALGLKGKEYTRYVNERLELIDELYKEQRRKFIEELSEKEGIKGAFRDIIEEYQRIGASFKQITKQFIYDIESELANTTIDLIEGRIRKLEDILSRIRSIVLRTIIDLSTKSLMSTFFSNLPIPESASFSGSGGSVRKMAEGGVVNKPTVALIGEAGYPEAVIPMKTGKIPVELRGQQQSQPIVVNVNVQAVDVNSFKKYEGQIVEVISNALKKGKLTNQVRRIL